MNIFKKHARSKRIFKEYFFYQEDICNSSEKVILRDIFDPK